MLVGLVRTVLQMLVSQRKEDIMSFKNYTITSITSRQLTYITSKSILEYNESIIHLYAIQNSLNHV